MLGVHLQMVAQHRRLYLLHPIVQIEDLVHELIVYFLLCQLVLLCFLLLLAVCGLGLWVAIAAIDLQRL